MLHLKSIKIRSISAGSANTFPFTIPAVKDLGELRFTAPVTFLVGENGSGKSTFDKTPPQPIPYEALEHVVITRSFLNDPEQYLRHL